MIVENKVVVEANELERKSSNNDKIKNRKSRPLRLQFTDDLINHFYSKKQFQLFNSSNRNTEKKLWNGAAKLMGASRQTVVAPNGL